MIQNNESKNENQPLETNLDDSLEVQQASETSAQTQNGHYINFSNGLDPPKTEDNHKLQSETPLPLYDDEHINAGLNNGDLVGTINDIGTINGTCIGTNDTVSHMVEWSAAGTSTSRMLDDINEALSTNKKTNIEEEPKYAQVKVKRNLTKSRPEIVPEISLEELEEPLLSASSTNDSAIAVESETATRTGQTTSTISAVGDLPIRPQPQVVMHVVNHPTNGQGGTHGRDALQSVVTALYCKLLIILGLAFPMAEVISKEVPKGYYQLFYVYLFLGSLIFLLATYIDLWRTKASWALTDKFKKNVTNHDSVDGIAHKLPRPRVHYGSFYLRLGAVFFGIGSMIYSGIEIGMFFELTMDKNSNCSNLFSVIRPILQMIFVFVQMYFVFLNQKMNIYKNKFMSRFGLMHMIATNICVWLNVLILETDHEIKNIKGSSHHKRDAHEEMVTNFTTSANFWMKFDISHMSSVCQRQNNIMSQLLADSGAFLFPCTIEYSLICAAILFIMWKNIAEEHEHYKVHSRRRKISRTLAPPITEHSDNEVTEAEHQERSAHHYSVDCTRANTGLFVGIIVMVFTIISLIVFFVLIKDEKLKDTAITVASLTELSLYCITSVAVLIAMCQMHPLWYDTSRQLELDNLLLVVAQTGVFIYSAFCIIGSFFQLEEHLLAFLASLATLVQTTLQTAFILDASSRFACTNDQVKRKPGREVVTFLLVCNLAMWAINTLETNRADSHPIQVEFYGGDWAWPIITHVSMPLAIFYRFHSTVCLCEIWKKSFKFKSHQSHQFA